MSDSPQKNDFLLTLRSLQQDGDDAISRPKIWGRPTPLEIKTKLSSYIDDLAKHLITAGEHEGRWIFLVGAPGNGKSAATGRLYRELTQTLKCTRQEPDTPPDQVEYQIELLRPNQKRPHDFLWLIQDASAVPNPGEADVDEAVELGKALQEAENSGVSIVVCANRGILERVCSNKDKAKKKWWKAVKQVVDGKCSINDPTVIDLEPTKKKVPFRKVEVAQIPLDLESLVIKTDYLDQYIDNATAEENWAICQQCSLRTLCPYRLNRDTLVNTLINDKSKESETKSGKERLLEILAAAEMWSGQLIVFREAAALIGYLLSGCPKDDAESKSPCEWVHKCTQEQDFISLLSRRIYMQLYASEEPHGLDRDDDIRDLQKATLGDVLKKLAPGNDKRKTLERVVKGTPLSTEVGVPRLLGAKGILSILDPCRRALDDDFLDEWSIDWLKNEELHPESINALERKAISFFAELREIAEENIEDDKNVAVGTIERWATAFLHRMGAFNQGKYYMKGALQEFQDNIDVASDEEELLHDIGERLTRIIRTVCGGEKDTVELSHCLSVGGDLIANMKAMPDTGNENRGIALAFRFAEKIPVTLLSGETFCWLEAVESKGLNPTCIPPQLLQGFLLARKSAISIGSGKGSNYACEHDITLVVTDPDENNSCLKRLKTSVKIYNGDEK